MDSCMFNLFILESKVIDFASMCSVWKTVLLKFGSG